MKGKVVVQCRSRNLQAGVAQGGGVIVQAGELGASGAGGAKRTPKVSRIGNWKYSYQNGLETLATDYPHPVALITAPTYVIDLEVVVVG